MASLEINVNQVNSDFNGIKTAITTAGVEVADGTATSEYADKVNEVYEKGKQAEYDAFWDSFQKNGTLQEYQFAFGSRAWNSELFKPKYDLIPTNLYMAFRQTGIVNLEECIEKAGIKWDTSNMRAGMFGYAFSESGLLEVIPEIIVPIGNKLGYTFYGGQYIHTIRKITILDENSTFDYAFTNCKALKNIVFEGNIGQTISFAQSSLLKKASIQSIISCLSNTASGKTLTVNQTAVNTAFGSTTSEEWLNLVATKPNWTISLSN